MSGMTEYESMEKVNDKFWKLLLIPPEVINRVPKTNVKTNNIILRNYIVYGNQGSGKSTTVRSIAQEIVKFYGKDNVSCTSSDSGNIDSMLDFGFRDKDVNVLFLDNITKRKISDLRLNEYFRARHILEDRFDRHNGYIISFCGVHRYYGLAKELRANENGLIVKDTTMNEYDRNLLKRRIGEKAILMFDMIENERLYDRSLMEIGFFVCKTFRGVIRNPFPTENCFEEAKPTLEWYKKWFGYEEVVNT